MKKLSETLTELGIAFTFPIRIEDANGNWTYYEDSKGWEKYEFDDNVKRTYFENSNGIKEGTSRSDKTLEGKVVEVDGVKYELKAL